MRFRRKGGYTRLPFTSGKVMRKLRNEGWIDRGTSFEDVDAPLAGFGCEFVQRLKTCLLNERH